MTRVSTSWLAACLEVPTSAGDVGDAGVAGEGADHPGAGAGHVVAADVGQRAAGWPSRRSAGPPAAAPAARGRRTSGARSYRSYVVGLCRFGRHEAEVKVNLLDCQGPRLCLKGMAGWPRVDPQRTDAPADRVVELDDFLWYVDRALESMPRSLDRPGRRAGQPSGRTLPRANSAYAIVTHCLGVMEHWGGEWIAGASGRAGPRGRVRCGRTRWTIWSAGSRPPASSWCGTWG